MKVLVACEFSGIVRDAFAARGHDAWSCDLLESERGGKHIMGDVHRLLRDGWDLMIAHPPCTYLCVAGMHRTVRGLRDPKLTDDALKFVRHLLDAPILHIALENPVSVISTRIRKPDCIVQPWQYGDDASKATCLWLKNLPKLEPYYPSVIPPKGWQRVMSAADMLECECCGEPFCPEHHLHYHECDCIGPMEDEVIYKERNGCLFATRQKPAPKMLWANQTPSGQNKLGPSPNRGELRSRTYQGIANAMADQWGQP